MSNIRITVACPEALISDANQLAMVLGQGPDDGRTYGVPGWQDAEGNLYAAASFLARPEWIGAVGQPLQRPAWDVAPYLINMTGAGRAQSALVAWLGDGPLPLAAPDRLTAIALPDPQAAMAAMGLQEVTADSDQE